MERKTEVEGRAKYPPHGVTFRLEIDSMRQTIMSHMQDYEGMLDSYITEAIASCMSKVEGEIAAAVNNEIRRQVEDMIRSRVHDVLWTEEVGEAIRSSVKDKLLKELG